MPATESIFHSIAGHVVRLQQHQGRCAGLFLHPPQLTAGAIYPRREANYRDSHHAVPQSVRYRCRLGNGTTRARPTFLPRASSPPEVTMESPPAPQRRKRNPYTHLACTSCKAKHVRCDGGRPACGLCVRKNRQCVYRDERNRRKMSLGEGELPSIDAKVKHVRTALSS